MKPFYLLLNFLLLIACSSSNKKTVTTTEKAVLMTDTLPTIGNCYVYKIKEDSIIGLILTSISKEDDSTYYSFFLSGKLFNSIPTQNEFKEAGLSGLSVPGPQPGEYQNTYCSYSISEVKLKSCLEKMILVDKVSNFSNKNMVGSSGGMENPGDLAIEYMLFEKSNAENKEQMKQLNFPPPVYRIFNWNSLLIATNPDDIAKPETIWILSAKTAHPAAAKLMTEDWFCSPIEDLSPFGNDSGSDAFYIFKDWRKDNLKVEPALFLDVLEQRWQMSFAHKNVTSEKDLELVEKTHQFYRHIDEAIIGVAFGQLVLEGTISRDLKQFGIKAIERTMLPMGMAGMSEGNKEEFIRRLKIMLGILNQF